MNPEFWANWAFYAYAFVWAPYTVAFFRYGFRSPWRVTAIGRALFTLLGAMTAVLSFVLIVLAFDLSMTATNILRGLTLGGVGLAGWMFLRELLVLQKISAIDDPCPKRRLTDVP